MKKRMIALLLALSALLGLLTGCAAEPAQTEDESEAPVLEKGSYELYDEDDELAGYLVCSGSKVTVYDADGGELLEKTKFEWDEDEECFCIDDEEAFELEVGRHEVTMTVPRNSPLGLPRGEYALEETDEEDIPTASGDDAGGSAHAQTASGDEGEAASVLQNCYAEGRALISVLDALCSDGGYRDALSLPEECRSLISGSAPHGEPSAVAAVSFNGDLLDEASRGQLEEAGIDEETYAAMMGPSLGAYLNAAVGSAALSAAASVSAGESFRCGGGELPAALLYAYDDAYAVLVSFTEGEAGAASAEAVLLFGDADMDFSSYIQGCGFGIDDITSALDLSAEEPSAGSTGGTADAESIAQAALRDAAEYLAGLNLSYYTEDAEITAAAQGFIGAAALVRSDMDAAFTVTAAELVYGEESGEILAMLETAEAFRYLYDRNPGTIPDYINSTFGTVAVAAGSVCTFGRAYDGGRVTEGELRIYTVSDGDTDYMFSVSLVPGRDGTVLATVVPGFYAEDIVRRCISGGC